MFPIRTALSALVLALALGSTSSAFARDDIASYSIKPALARVDADEKLDPQIKLYFGKQPHGPVAKFIGEWKSNKKANGFGRSDEVACQRAFISALISLQKRARSEGGNAVIEIISNYKSVPSSSNTTYVCGSGGLMSGVALIGRVVRIGR